MEIVEKYKCEITGDLFDSEEQATASETKHQEVIDTFAFYKMPKDDVEGFPNGHVAIQRDEEFYLNLLDGIIKMVNKYEESLLRHYHGDLKREHIKGHSQIGRFLDDGDSPLYKWWGIQANICQKCFREYGQMFFANTCSCSHRTPTIQIED